MVVILVTMFFTLIFGAMMLDDCKSDRVWAIAMLFAIVLVVQAVVALKMVGGVV